MAFVAFFGVGVAIGIGIGMDAYEGTLRKIVDVYLDTDPEPDSDPDTSSNPHISPIR